MWFVRDSALAGTAVIHCFNTLNNCSTSITNQPTTNKVPYNEMKNFCLYHKNISTESVMYDCQQLQLMY